MRAVIVAFLRSIVAVSILAASEYSSLAKSSSDAPNTSEEFAPRCDASQLGPNGSWIRIPCQEVDSGTPAKQKTSTRTDSEVSR
jgi:hypothetical protein